MWGMEDIVLFFTMLSSEQSLFLQEFQLNHIYDSSLICFSTQTQDVNLKYTRRLRPASTGCGHFWLMMGIAIVLLPSPK